MTTVSNSIDSYAGAHPEYQSLRQFLIYSLIMHGSVALVIAVSAFIQFRNNQWGGVGGDLGGTKVSLVSSAGIPMPKETVVTESKAVDPTKGLYKEEPPKPPEPKTDATKIPKFEKEKPLPPSRPSRTLDNRTPPPDNAVPYGKGGNPDLPTGYSSNSRRRLQRLLRPRPRRHRLRHSLRLVHRSSKTPCRSQLESAFP